MEVGRGEVPDLHLLAGRSRRRADPRLREGLPVAGRPALGQQRRRRTQAALVLRVRDAGAPVAAVAFGVADAVLLVERLGGGEGGGFADLGGDARVAAGAQRLLVFVA